MNNIPFHWYAGQALASLLPYRKKRLIFGPKVCEWPAVMYMAEAGFFAGCSLSLADKPAAEEVLTEATAPLPWRDAFSEGIGYLERGHTKGATTFEGFYPEITSNEFNIARTAEECVVRVAQQVVQGLMLGILFPETALSMLKAWVTQPEEWKDLGTGGLRVKASPLVASVEEAYVRARTIYEEWRLGQQ